MSTSISGPILVSPQDVFSSSATQGTRLGAKATLGDGRVFRYCLAGATALVAGKLQQASAEDTTNYQNLAAAALAVGDKTITISSSITATANILSEGYVVVTTSTGAGYTYAVAGNTAVTAATGMVVTLEDAVLAATAASTSKFDFIPNPFSKVIINPTTASSAPVGVALYPVTAAQYGWLLVKGVAGVLIDDQTIAVGTNVAASNQADGAIEPHTGVQALVGVALTGGATTQYVLINFNIA